MMMTALEGSLHMDGWRGVCPASRDAALNYANAAAMTQAAYRIIRTESGFKIEINRPGEAVHVAVGFESEADAKSWIEEDKRITGINDRQEPIDPPNLRKV
jgi:hypothetical protein